MTYPLLSNSTPCGDSMFLIFSLDLPYSIIAEASQILPNCPFKGAEMEHVSLTCSILYKIGVHCKAYCCK